MARAGDIGDTERAFRDWRRCRVVGAAIPEALWERAAEVARVDGVAETARRLRLNQTRLKRRCDDTARESVGFVELTANELSGAGESVVEIEEAGVRRLRVVLRGASVAAVTAAAKELWGAAR